MKILHVTKFYPPQYYGGIETVCKDLVDLQISHGNKVTVICNSTNSKNLHIKEENFKLYACSTILNIFSQPISLNLIFYLYKMVSRHDIIHVHFPNPIISILICIFKIKSPILIHWHSDIVKQKFILYLFRFIQNQSISKATHVIGATKAHIESSSCYSHFQTKCSVVPYYIKSSLEPNICDSVSSELNTFFNQHKNKKIILSVGRLVSYKGFINLINATKYLDSKYIVCIVGSGPLKKQLIKSIIKLGLEKRVFLLGKLKANDLSLLYKKCFIFCLPSVTKAEMFGVVQIEAMMFGKPVISTNILGSGVPYVNVHKETGLLVSPNNSRDIAYSINMISDNDTYSFYSNNALEKSKKYTSNELYITYLNLYLKLIK
jgi:glycosyltransferase involved in cell wall biosynthesis